MFKRNFSEMNVPKLDFSLQSDQKLSQRGMKHFSLTNNVRSLNLEAVTENQKHNSISQAHIQKNNNGNSSIQCISKNEKFGNSRAQLKLMIKKEQVDQISYSNYYYGKINEIMKSGKNNNQIYDSCMESLNAIHQLVTQYQPKAIFSKQQLQLQVPNKKYTVAIDLDETLIHSESVQLNKLYDYKNHKFGTYFRPHCQYFLQRLAIHADLYIYTAANKKYAKIILDAIDPNRKFIKNLFTQEDCILTLRNSQVKDITIINSDLTKTFLIDNNPQSFTAQPENGIPIVPFYENKDDNELMILLSFIEKEIFTCENVQQAIRRYFQFEQFRQFENGVQAFFALYD